MDATKYLCNGGHINIGRTLARGVIFGAHRTKGKITITYERTPEWLEGHKGSVGQNDATHLVLAADNDKSLSTKTSDPNDVISQLERLAKLKEQGILTEEELQAQKKKILGI
jgi:hypothetical protein